MSVWPVLVWLFAAIKAVAEFRTSVLASPGMSPKLPDRTSLRKDSTMGSSSGTFEAVASCSATEP